MANLNPSDEEFYKDQPVAPMKYKQVCAIAHNWTMGRCAVNPFTKSESFHHFYYVRYTMGHNPITNRYAFTLMSTHNLITGGWEVPGIDGIPVSKSTHFGIFHEPNSWERDGRNKCYNRNTGFYIFIGRASYFFWGHVYRIPIIGPAVLTFFRLTDIIPSWLL